MGCRGESLRGYSIRSGADSSYVDVLESEMGAEVENGRIARLLIKLGFINERAE